jgi:hypothetical protein
VRATQKGDVSVIPQENIQSAANTKEFLLTSGFSPKLNGFRYILTAIDLLREDRSLLKRMTKRGGLYESVAERYGETIEKVERSIRHAIAKAVKTQAFSERFGRYFEYLPVPPSNGAFLALVAELFSPPAELKGREQN